MMHHISVPIQDLTPYVTTSPACHRSMSKKRLDGASCVEAIVVEQGPAAREVVVHASGVRVQQETLSRLDL